MNMQDRRWRLTGYLLVLHTVLPWLWYLQLEPGLGSAQGMVKYMILSWSGIGKGRILMLWGHLDDLRDRL